MTGRGWIDKHGDVWTLGDDGLLHTPETAPFSREHVEKKWGPLRPVADHTPEPVDVGTREALEAACEVMHDAYEAAATEAGWETQERSRKPWADVPEANKATMRVAVRALIDHLTSDWLAAREADAEKWGAEKALRDLLDEIDEIPGTHVRVADEVDVWLHATSQVENWIRERADREAQR